VFTINIQTKIVASKFLPVNITREKLLNPNFMKKNC